MQMGLDEAGGDETTIEVDRLALGLEPRCDRRDLSRGDPDIAAPAIVYSRIFQNDVHGHASPSGPGGIDDHGCDITIGETDQFRQVGHSEARRPDHLKTSTELSTLSASLITGHRVIKH